jgi:hypothetical protein
MPDKGRLLELALKGLQAERAKIDDEIAEIKSQLNPQSTAAKTSTDGKPSTAPPRKTLSAEARMKISEAMKRRYAALRKAAKK